MKKSQLHKFTKAKSNNHGSGYARNSRNEERAKRLNTTSTEQKRREERINKAIKQFMENICEGDE